MADLIIPPPSPDLSGYAKTTDITAAAASNLVAMQALIPPAPNLTPYALKTDVPSVAGLATTASVVALQAQIPSVSGLAKTSDVTTAISTATAPLATAAALTTVQSSIPVPASTTPPGVSVAGAPGSASMFARADHTHATSVQRTRLQVAGGAGQVVWTFATPYDAGVIPDCFAFPEAPVGATAAWTVQIAGTPTNTSVTFKVFGPPTVTVGVLGTAANVSFPVAANGVWLHVQASKPTQ